MTENNYEQEMELGLRELIALLWQRKWLILLIFILAVGASYYISGQMTRIYETSTLIMIRDSSGVQDIFGEQLSLFTGRTNRVSTYSQLLKTRPILADVIRRLELRDEETGEYISVRSLENNISVRGDTETNLITINVQFNDPAVARDIANNLVDVFIEDNERMNRAHLLRASHFISEQLESTQARLMELEGQLLDYKTEQGIVYPAEQGKAILNKLIELEITRAQAEVELAYARTSLQEIESHFHEQEREVVSSRTISINPEIRELRSWLLNLELELSGLLEVYTESHPRVVEVKKKITEVERRLEDTVEEITSSRTEAVNPLFRSLMQDIIQLQTSIIAAETKIDIYNHQIEEVSKQLSALPEEEMALIRLERENKVTENLYLLLMERQAEVQIQEAMQAADIVVVSPAVIEPDPISPRIKLNVALAGVLALFVGIGLAFLLEFLDTTVKTEKELVKVTGIPVLGVIPDLTKVDHSRGYGREDEDA